MMKAETPHNRKWRWLLAGSLALNLLFVGLFAGAALRHFGDDRGARGPGVGPQNYGAPFVQALPPSARKELRRDMRSTDGRRASRAERRAKYEQIVTALRAPEFDAASVSAVLATQANTAQNVETRGQTKWLALISEMSAAERATVADNLEAILERRSHKKKRP